MVSDPPEVGGDLQLLLSPKENGFKILAETQNQPAQEILFDVKFPAAGYAVFLHGSQVMHHVTPVIEVCNSYDCNLFFKAKSDRITLVHSYTATDPFAPDTTVYRYQLILLI
jgi:hypothetical protein